MSTSEKELTFKSQRTAQRKLSSTLPAVSTSVRESTATTYDPAQLRTKLLLVPFRSGEAVARHPEIAPYLKEGWDVKSASPRVTPEGTKLLVVLG